jgi:hypothetical protein
MMSELPPYFGIRQLCSWDSKMFVNEVPITWDAEWPPKQSGCGDKKKNHYLFGNQQVANKPEMVCKFLTQIGIS